MTEKRENKNVVKIIKKKKKKEKDFSREIEKK